MTVPLSEMLKKLPVRRRKRIEAEADRLHAEYLLLRDLRKAKELTQVELSKKLKISQASVANMEKRSDLLLSTLRNYVEATGGSLELTVSYPNRPPVALRGLGDTENLKEEARV